MARAGEIGAELSGAGDPSPGAVHEQPWPHLVLDRFLPDKVLAVCLAEIRGRRYAFEIEGRGAGRIEFSLLESEAMWRAIYSTRMVRLLSEAFGVRVRLNKHNLVQLRRMNAATPEFPRHNDSSSQEETIAVFLYLSEGWTAARGGRLHLYRTGDQDQPSVSVAPLQNRLVAFRTRPNHWHSVERVDGWERLSVLSLWDVVET